MRVEELRRLERAERMMIRWMCGVTLKDRCKSEELRKRLDIEDVADVIRMSRLRWFGHLERKEEEDWVSACRNMVVPGNSGKGRPRKRWRDVFIGRCEKRLSRWKSSEGQRQMKGSNHGENVRPVRARKKGSKMRRARETS